MKDNGVVCAAFWRSVSVRQDGTYSPCCRYRDSLGKFEGFDKILSSTEYQDLRNKSLQGIKIPGCQKCYHEEERGSYSIRNWINSLYDTEKVELNLVYAGFNNICNLTCDGCNPGDSSSWGNMIQGTKSKKNIIKLNKIPSAPSTLDRVIFLGGEPLMTNYHYNFLLGVENKSEVNVEYNTNGTFLFSKKVIDLLSEFKSILITLSVDGYAKVNEQVRSGTKWEDVTKFIDQVKSLGYALRIHTVIHKNNWYDLPNINEYIKFLNVNWRINLLTYPKNLDIATLDPGQKEKCVEMVKNLNFSSTLSFKLETKEGIIKHVLNNH